MSEDANEKKVETKPVIPEGPKLIKINETFKREITAEKIKKIKEETE